MASKKKSIKILIIAAVAILLVAVYLFLPKYLGDEVYPLKYTDLITKYAEKYDVNPALVAAVILQESRFNPKAVSPAGAKGIMQFMPATAATMAKQTGRWPNYDLFDPETSIEFGAAHLKDMLNKYDGDLDKALASYNAGGGTVDGWIRSNIFEKVIGSNSKSETVQYVKKVKNYMNVYETMYAKELGLAEKAELKAIDPGENEAKVRGFVWYQIFANVLSFGR